MSVKAKLKVVLQANNVVVAEAEDADLWQKVLNAINKGGAEHFAEDAGGQRNSSNNSGDPPPGSNDALSKFANQLGLQPEIVQGACEPKTEKPFLHLDMHCWEEMKKQTPQRGPGAYSPIGVAATLLALWSKHADLGNATQAQAQAVLATIGGRDPNPSRGIQRCTWLQSRGGGSIVLNPAQISRAVKIARSFCSKSWTDE